jgi:hypothetical protein
MEVLTYIHEVYPLWSENDIRMAFCKALNTGSGANTRVPNQSASTKTSLTLRQDIDWQFLSNYAASIFC